MVQDMITGSAQRQYSKKMEAFLGTSDKHNIYEAEATAEIMAIWILETTLETVSKRVSLFIDNQSIITAVKMPKAK